MNQASQVASRQIYLLSCKAGFSGIKTQGHAAAVVHGVPLLATFTCLSSEVSPACTVAVNLISSAMHIYSSDKYSEIQVISYHVLHL
jgi:hypothetical protein